jgi:uncharacterized tellurite resistance protein B-like protein
MPLLLILVFLIFLVIALRHVSGRAPNLPNAFGSWGSSAASDPRVAVAAMMCSVASEDGPLTAEKERHILTLLASKIGLEDRVARECFTGGRRIARNLRGDLNSRLHQLIEPIERKCSREEKEDVVDMLHTIAGRSADRLGPVREGLGRVSASLLAG